MVDENDAAIDVDLGVVAADSCAPDGIEIDVCEAALDAGVQEIEAGPVATARLAADMYMLGGGTFRKELAVAGNRSPHTSGEEDGDAWFDAQGGASANGQAAADQVRAGCCRPKVAAGQRA